MSSSGEECRALESELKHPASRTLRGDRKCRRLCRGRVYHEEQDGAVKHGCVCQDE